MKNFGITTINVGVGFNQKHVRLHLEWVLDMFNEEGI